MIAKILLSFGCGVASMLGTVSAIGILEFAENNKEKLKTIVEVIKSEFSRKENE